MEDDPKAQDLTEAAPVTWSRNTTSSLARRLVALILVLATGAVLGVAVYLAPDARGHGTHEQLGLPQCNWVAAFDTPCPTCGMTTSFTYAAEGDFLSSIHAQPLGFLLAILTACTFLVSLYVLVTGSAVGGMLAGMWRPRMIWLIVGVLVIAWGYKILSFKGIIS